MVPGGASGSGSARRVRRGANAACPSGPGRVIKAGSLPNHNMLGKSSPARLASTWRLAFALLLAARFLPAAAAAEFKFPGQTITVPDGFEVEQVAGPPLVLRPMMADFDELGRLYVADSAGSNDKVEKQLAEKPHRIVRLEDTDGDGRFDRSVVFADKLMFPEGVLWFDGAVYTGAPPSIWKLEDTDGDGVADRRTEWHQGKTLTGCANDLHGPYLGPDGWIYWCKGAFARQTYPRPGYRPIDDSAAHVFRARPDHTALDAVMSGGMDNPVEVAWSPEGELFFITTFFHHPAAGRRDAIVHCLYGGAYPKPHGVLDAVQKTGDLLPALVELGPAAACALMRYESGAFGPEFRDNLFSTLFNLRKVMRHVLTPLGGTYTAASSDFLVSDNPDFHPTDVFEDADGSLLVIDTGGWYKLCCPTSQLPKPDVLGAIYRVRRTGQPRPADPRGLKLPWPNLSPAELTQLLDDARPAVRDRALRTLARRGPEAVPALEAALKSDSSVLRRRNAVWALTRLDGAAARAAVRLALNDPDESVRRAALHAVAMHRDAAAFEKMLALLRDGAGFEQRKAAEALGRIGRPEAVPALLEAAASFRAKLPAGHADAERIQEHALIYALIEIADPAATRRGLAADSPHTRRAALIALDQMDHGGLTAADVAPLLSSPDPVLRQTAAWIAEHHPDWGGQFAEHFRRALAQGDFRDAERADLERQLARFARSPGIQELLVGVLGDAATPPAARLLAARAMAQSGLNELPAAWWTALKTALTDRDAELARAAVAVLRALPVPKPRQPELAAVLSALGGEADRPVELRLEALAAMPGGLAAVEPPVFALLLAELDPARPVARRSAAAKVLARARLTEAQWLALADALRTVGPMELNPLLEAFEGATSEAVGQRLVAALAEAKALASVRVDLLNERLAAFPASVQAAGRALLARLDADPVQQAAQLEALLAELRQLPGDIRRGQAIFNSPKTACATCHMMGYLGGRVGPDLTSIGQIRTERDLLEALLYPSASFVRSYEPVVVTLKDGEEVSGIVRSENDAELVLVVGADQEQRLPRSEVVDMRPGTVSLMPAGLADQLTRQELADLLAFLKATRWGAQ
jgi:putative membrane-bound dehydrogenase-like protein